MTAVAPEKNAEPVVRRAWFERPRPAILALLTLLIVLWLPRLNGPIDLRWDGGVYYILGTSLAQGNGYTLLNEPGHAAAVQYPPLFPLLIAGMQTLLRTADPIVVGQFLRLFFFLTSALYIVAVYLLMRRFLPARVAFFGGLLCQLHLYSVFMADLCFPEMPFCLLVVVFFLVSGRGGRGSSILAGILAVATFLLRTAGVALLAAWIAEALVRKRWKTAAVRIVVALVPILCWQMYIRQVESSHDYIHPAYAYQRADYQFNNVSYVRNLSLRDPFAPELGKRTQFDALRRIFVNAWQMPMALGEGVSLKRDYAEPKGERFQNSVFFQQILPPVVYTGLVVLGILVLAGIGILAARRQWLIVLYIVFAVTMVAATPWPQQFLRYLMPLIPFLILCFLEARQAILRAATHRVAAWWRGPVRVVAAGVVPLILVAQIVVLLQVFVQQHQLVGYTARDGSRVAYRLFFYKEDYQALEGGLDWLAQHSQPGDVVATASPHWIYLRTGLQAVLPPFELNPEQAQNLLDQVPARFLLLEKGAFDTAKYVRPVVERFPERWQMIYQDLPGEFAIYERRQPVSVPENSRSETR